MFRYLSAVAICIAGIAGAQTIPAPGLVPQAEGRPLMLHFAQGREWAPVPYEAVKGDILFQATVNGRPASVLLDNGTERTLVDAGFAQRLGIGLRAFTGQAVTGASTRLAMSGTDTVTMEAPHAFTIKGPLVAIDLTPMSTALGRRVDAVLGADMLDHFAVMIQPGKRLLSLAASGNITGQAGTVVVPLIEGNLIEAEINGQPVRLRVDLGFNGVIRLTDAAWQRAFPAGSTGAGSQTTADGVTRITRSGRAELRIGDVRARNVAVDSGYAPDGASQGLLGNGFLSRGTSVLDVKKKQLMLVPRQPSAK